MSQICEGSILWCLRPVRALFCDVSDLWPSSSLGGLRPPQLAQPRITRCQMDYPAIFYLQGCKLSITLRGSRTILRMTRIGQRIVFNSFGAWATFDLLGLNFGYIIILGRSLKGWHSYFPAFTILLTLNICNILIKVLPFDLEVTPRVTIPGMILKLV